MKHLMRFGRRIPLPSTAAIKHELRMMMHADRIRALEQKLSDIDCNYVKGTALPLNLRGLVK